MCFDDYSLGVTPILYTYLKTIYISFVLRRILASYDIQTSVHSRLLSGIVEVDVPAYQLSLYPRHMDGYWSHKSVKGAKHGASWQSFNWMRRPTEEKTLQIHFSDRIQLPQSSISFSDLIFYLGDLGIRTSPDGFWELARNGLQVLPGTVLCWQFSRTDMPIPILVIAKPTIEHHGSLLLRFQNIPQKSLRTSADLDPSWIEIPAYMSSPTTDPTLSSSQEIGPTGLPREKPTPPVVSHVRIARKGVVEKRLVDSQTLPVLGLPFWFTYSILACTARGNSHRYDGRPNGYHMRLEILYFARECVIPIGNIAPSWRNLFTKLLDSENIEAIPVGWTEDSPRRKNAALRKRFELLIDDQLRFRSAHFRRERRGALKLAAEGFSEEVEALHVPVEAFAIMPAVWTEFTTTVSDFLHPLRIHHLPTSQEICLAATSNVELAAKISGLLMVLQKAFEGKGDFSLFAQEPSKSDMAIFLCAMVVLQSIAEFSPYLAALSDVEACVSKWNPVYLC